MKWTFAFLVVFGCGGNEADNQPEPEPEPVATSGTETETAPVEPTDGASDYSADLELICNRSLQESGYADAAPENKATILARYIEENLETDQAKDLFSALATMASEVRVETLTREAENQGIECAIVRVWAAPPADP